MYALFFLHFPLWLLWTATNYPRSQNGKIQTCVQFASNQDVTSRHLKLHEISQRYVSVCVRIQTAASPLCSGTRGRHGVEPPSFSRALPHYNFSIRRWLKSGADCRTRNSPANQGLVNHSLWFKGERWMREGVMNGPVSGRRTEECLDLKVG